MRLALHREIPENSILAGQWNDLVQRMESPEVFYTYEWALAVSRAYSDSLTPLLMLAYEGNSLVGVAALATDNKQSETSFLAGTTADYCDFVSAPELRQELLELVLSELRVLATPKLVLSNVPADSTTARVLALSADHEAFNLFPRPAFQCAQISLRTADQRASVAHCLRHKRERRYLKSLSARIPVALDHLQTWQTIAAALPVFTTAHVARFAVVERVSNLDNPQRIDFLSELAQLLAPRGWITLSQLRAGDRPMAWQYAFRFARHHCFYLTTFDQEFREYSPGFCLLVTLVEEACDSGEVDFIDLGLGSEDYKKRLATNSRETRHFTLATSAVTCWKVAARYHAAAAIKTSPRLEHYVRRVLGRDSTRDIQA